MVAQSTAEAVKECLGCPLCERGCSMCNAPENAAGTAREWVVYCGAVGIEFRI